MIDIACTAVIRPKLIETTFKSFSDRLFKNHECKLILNIDPVGEDSDPDEIIQIGKKYFNDVIFNVPKIANFSKAFKWVIENCKSEYIFYLQDDWLLLVDMDLEKMINLLSTHNKLACIKLKSKGGTKHKNILSIDGQKIAFSPIFYGHPALWKKAFFDSVMPLYSEATGPERQFRYLYQLNSEKMKEAVTQWNFGSYCDPPQIQDIGRKWMRNSKWVKNLNGEKYISGWKLKVEKETLNIDLGAAKHPTYNHLKWKVMDISEDCEYYYNINSGGPMPLPDNSVNNFYSSMTFEHIRIDCVENVLKEIQRILMPGGRVRLVVPDISLAAKWYIDNDVQSLSRGHTPYKPHHYPVTTLGYFLAWIISEPPKGKRDRAGHNMAFDFETMKWYMEKVGFKNIQKMSYNKTSEPFENKDIKSYAHYALYVEAQK